MNIVDGVMPGKIRVEVNSSKYSFMIFFSTDAFAKRQPDRTYLARYFDLNSNKRINYFYFVLTSRTSLKGKLKMDFAREVVKNEDVDIWEKFEQSDAYNLATRSLYLKSLKTKHIIRQNAKLGTSKRE